jgi:hypothetical protein
MPLRLGLPTEPRSDATNRAPVAQAENTSAVVPRSICQAGQPWHSITAYENEPRSSPPAGTGESKLLDWALARFGLVGLISRANEVALGTIS